MTMTRIDYLQRELQVMNEQKALIKKQRNDLERIQFSDIQWLKIRLTDIIQTMNIRIEAKRRELVNEETQERIRKARERNNGSDSDKG
jgi:hypothetical protein